MMEPAPRPTLHEIAAMPFPASTEAMRKFYDPKWGCTDPAEAPRARFKVTVEYSTVTFGEWSDTVEAQDEEEALEIAKQAAEDDTCGEDFDVLHTSIRRLEEESA